MGYRDPVSQLLEPRPAATVLLVRDGAHGVEVLMLRRNLNSDFVGGAYVFPGGGVDAHDRELAIRLNVDEAALCERLGVSSGALAYCVAAIREAFEESGLLLARHRSGRDIDFSNTELRERFDAHRNALNNRERRFGEILDEEELDLAIDSLGYYSHWVTPIGPPRRYDTRFFVALAPSDQAATHDAGETVADVWVRPIDALEMARRGELEMIFPTIKNLEMIAHLSSAHEVLAFAHAQGHIPRIEPRIVVRDGITEIVMPEGVD